ncbi:MAG: SLBB domain-containing protein [Candidatus Latescibacterota bacterium]|nr:SLBB domain-containing protein [Candidatus Latescibacterota bacterium]
MIRNIPAVVLILFFLVCSSVVAQDDDELQSLIDDSAEDEAELQNVPGAGIPGMDDDLMSGKVRMPSGEEVERLRISQDREINPDEYLVGPGDVIQLYVWGEFDIAYMLQVDPEGSVVIPTVGSFQISELTLTEAKNIIYSAAQGKYPGVEVTVSLVSMRFFTAYVTGAVLTEGSLTVTPTTRVSDLIERSGGFLDELQGRTIQEEVGGIKVTRARRINNRPAARRSIEVISREGKVEKIDLAMFFATGDVLHNPYVRMGDVVHVGFSNESCYVYGAVNNEGIQEFRPGDTVGDLVALSGGLRGDAPLMKIELWRFQPGTEIMEQVSLGDDTVSGQEIDLNAILSTPLAANDMVFFRARSLWQQMPTVLVYGEVKYRGRYRINQGKTRVRDIVDGPAGGLTERASFLGAKVIRTKLRNQIDPEYTRLSNLAKVGGYADMSDEDKAYMKTKAREEKGRAVVDFERLYDFDDQTQNIQLESGDVIYIPTVRRTVTVSGQLKKPGLIDFEEGLSVSEYLDLAGGFSTSAHRSGARLIRARTGIREDLEKDLVVEAGDEIWVPEENRIRIWETFQSTMRTLAETLTILILVRSL